MIFPLHLFQEYTEHKSLKGLRNEVFYLTYIKIALWRIFCMAPSMHPETVATSLNFQAAGAQKHLCLSRWVNIFHWKRSGDKRWRTN